MARALHATTSIALPSVTSRSMKPICELVSSKQHREPRSYTSWRSRAKRSRPRESATSRAALGAPGCSPYRQNSPKSCEIRTADSTRADPRERPKSTKFGEIGAFGWHSSRPSERGPRLSPPRVMYVAYRHFTPPLGMPHVYRRSRCQRVPPRERRAPCSTQRYRTSDTDPEYTSLGPTWTLPSEWCVRCVHLRGATRCCPDRARADARWHRQSTKAVLDVAIADRETNDVGQIRGGSTGGVRSPPQTTSRRSPPSSRKRPSRSTRRR